MIFQGCYYLKAALTQGVMAVPLAFCIIPLTVLFIVCIVLVTDSPDVETLKVFLVDAAVKDFGTVL